MAATLTVDLNAKIAQFETEMKRATGTLDKFGKRGDAVAAGLKGAFAGMAAALSVGALASFAKSGIDAADALNDMSQRTGVAVKTLAEYQLAATLADTSLDDLAKGIQRLVLTQGKAEQGGKAQAQALMNLGISAKDPKIAFEQLADAVANSNDPNRTAADLAVVLGKSYVNLLPLLQGGAKGLRDSAAASATFSESMAKLAPNAAKFNDQLDILKSNAAGAAASILSELVPSLNEYIAVGREVVNNGTLLDKVRFFGIGNASDEVVNRVRINLAASAGWMDRLRQSAGAANAASKPKSGEPKKTKAIGARTSASKSDPQGAFVDKLRQEASTLGLGSAALQKYEASKLKLTGTNAKLAAGFIAQIAAFNEQKAAAEENNKAFDEAIRKQDELDATLEGSIKSLRDWLTEQEFEASLIGKTNIERETAIQLRTLETAGIDTQAASYKALAAQIAAANSDRRVISILSGTQTEKTKEFMADIEAIDKLFFDGKVSAAQFAEVIELITGSTEKASKEMDTFAENAAKGIQSSLADFLFDPFDKGLDGMLEGFGKMLQRMIAEAAAAQIARELFGELGGGAKGDTGIAGTALAWIGSLVASANGNAFSNGAGLSAYSGTIVSTPTVFPFAKGMGLMGEAGPEAILPLKRGANGKLGVAGGGGGNNITVNVNGSNNAPDVRRAAGQGAREALGMLSGARRYG